MIRDAAADELRKWCSTATDGMASAIEAAPDATVPAYPSWTVRDLAVHVVRIYGNATIAVRTGVLERPSPDLAVTRDDAPATLAAAVQDALRAAEAALDGCGHDVVWTPVGAGHPDFWRRRLLREAVLHRWDAEQADGAAAAPDDEHALELIDEFLDTDVTRALNAGEPDRPGVLRIRAGGRRWTVDLANASIDTTADATAGTDATAGEHAGADAAASEYAGPDAGDAAVTATVSGDPATVWLWLVRRDGLPGAISVDDVDGTGSFFGELIDGFNRPNR